MKDIKSLYLLIFALILITISFILITIWGYHFYFGQPANKMLTQNNVEVKKAPQPLFSENNNDTFNTGKKISSTQTDSMLRMKLAEIEQLTEDIRQILQNQSVSTENAAASKQIEELQQSVDDLRSQNYQMQQENGRLNKMMEELLANKPVNKRSDDAKGGNSKTVSRYAASLPLLVAHLRFTAFTGNPQTPTSIAAKAEYLTGSFIINVKPDNHFPRIYVVIIAPDARILSENETKHNTFKTVSGIKEYSVALSFNNQTDNQKRLHFSISSSLFKKGKYTMQIYHQGVLIGRMNRTLY